MKENIISQINIASKLESRLKANQEPVMMQADFHGIPFSEEDSQTAEYLNQFKTTLLEQTKAGLNISSFKNIDLTAPLEKAALSGKVEPAALFETSVTEEQRQLALSAISKDFNIEATDKVAWTLKPEKRTAILSEMILDGTMKDKIGQPLPSTDMFGEMLRKIITEGSAVKLEDLSDDQLKATRSVIDLTNQVAFPKPAIEQVTEYIKPADLMDDYSILSGHFIGRENELKRLHDFVITQHPPVNSPYWSGMIVTGAGGVGKSTLLAKFIGDIKNWGEATIVILDFDRPGINPEDSVWLEREITRQVGLQYPQFEKRLKALREESRLFGRNQGIPNFSFSGSEESARYSKSLIYEVRDMLKSVTTQPPYFVLVFDTIEEASQRFLIGRLCEWINYLADIMSGISLKVIFSGRLYDNSLTEIRAIPQVIDSLEINEFDQSIALQFLEKHGVKPNVAHNILQSGSVPQRPLELKLVAKLLVEGTMSEKELLKDLKENRDSSGEFFAGIIYRRVLMRVNDPVLQKMAYPGLILRYLTPEIILNILCPVLQITIADLEQAGLVLQQLASYNWLCYIDSQGKVWHRKDLRRSMIQYMELHEPERILAVRTKAIEYFTLVDTKELTAESIYHQLMMMKDPADGEKFDLNDLNQAYEFIFSDLNDLPKFAAILLKFSTDQNIKDKDVFCLPDKFLYAKYHPTGRNLVKNREYFNAYQLFQRVKKKNKNWSKVLDVSPTDWNDNWEQELLYAIVEWDKAKKSKSYQQFFSFRQAEFSLLEFVYPACFIHPGDIKKDEFIKRLNNFISITTSNSGTDNFFRYQIFFNRFSSSLVILSNYGILENSIIKLIEKLIENFNTEEKSGSVEKSRFLLSCITGNAVRESYRISHSQLKLDSGWLLKLRTLLTGQPSDNSIENEKTLTALANICNPENAVSSKNLLSLFDTQYSNVATVTDLKISLFDKEPNEIFSLLEGPSLLFRDPCRYALLNAFTTYNDHKKLAKIIQSQLTVQLTDLDPNIFALGLTANRELALEPFIEIIDRSWGMEGLLTAACAAKPRNKKLRTICNAYTFWRTALRDCINQSNRTTNISNTHNKN